MARKCIFIHIGLAKTGTKSIQFALAQRRAKLAQAGWFYPREGTSTNRSGHHGVAWYLQRAKHHHPALLKFDLASFNAAVANAAEQNIIVSSEAFSALSNDESAIRSLLDLFPAHDVFVVVYLREQLEFINSYYVELLGNLSYTASIGRFLSESLDDESATLSRLLNFGNFLSVWRRILGERVIVRPFDPLELHRGNVVCDFADILGIQDVLKPLPPRRLNKQLNPRQVSVLIGLSRLLAARGVTWELYSDLHRHLRRTVADILEDPELAMRQPFWGTGPVLGQRVRDHFRDSNNSFFSEVLGRNFEFSAIRQSRRSNAVAYASLRPNLRSRFENRLLQSLSEMR